MPALPALLAELPAASPFAFDLNSRRCHRLDLSEANPTLQGLDPADSADFGAWIARQLAAAGADYAAGGYAENRALYRMSPRFRTADEDVRTLHLGIDLWITAGTAVHAVLPGVVHSTADNNAFGDYGPTVILEHSLQGERFYTLYGHLARPTLERTRTGQRVAAGELIGWLGEPHENVGWPPHLHLQVIRNLEGRSGDYPGVCKFSERALWLERCPDPNLLLRIEALTA
jgi:murein DD-endopeptidase MepM/ murein hydrolase activator NlpD